MKTFATKSHNHQIGIFYHLFFRIRRGRKQCVFSHVTTSARSEGRRPQLVQRSQAQRSSRKYCSTSQLATLTYPPSLIYRNYLFFMFYRSCRLQACLLSFQQLPALTCHPRKDPSHLASSSDSSKSTPGTRRPTHKSTLCKYTLHSS